MKIKLEIKVMEKSQLAEASVLWQKLEKKVPNPPLVCRWDWVNTWLTHYGDIVDYWFCVGYVGKDIVGITIVTKETKRYLPFPVNTYHLGTQGEPLKDWVHMVNNTVLAVDEHFVAFTKVLAKTLTQNFSWEEFIVDDANPGFANPFYAASSRFVRQVKKIIHTCYIVNLDAIRKDNKTIFDYFSRDTRYQIKRNLKEFGELEIAYANSATEAQDIFAELQMLHQRALIKKGKRGSYASERFINFHNDIIQALFPTGAIIMYRVVSKRLGTLGCFYLFNDNGTAFGYSSGLNDFSDIEITTINKKRLKPGFVMHALCMQECLDRGIKEYNFSTGSQGYKLELTSDTTTLVTVKLQRSYKAKVRDFLYEGYLQAEEQQQFQRLLKPLYAVYLRLNK